MLLPALAQNGATKSAGDVKKGVVTATSRRSRSNSRPEATARREEASSLEAQAEKSWHEAGNYKEAERLFKESIALHSSDPFRKIAFSQMLAEQGKTSEAFSYYKDAVHPDPSVVSQSGVFDPLILARYGEVAKVAGAQSEVKWASREIARTASLNYPAFPKFSDEELNRLPVDALAELAVGLALDNRNKGEEAQATFNSVSKRHPDLALAHLLAAQQYERNVGPGYLPARAEYAKAAKTTAPLWTKKYANGVNVKQAAQKRLDKLAESGYMDGGKFVPAKIKKEIVAKSEQ